MTEGKRLIGCLTLGWCVASAAAGQADPVAWWRFECQDQKIALDSISNTKDAIQGNAQYVGGVNGNGIKLDGYTAHVIRKPTDAPRLTGAFSVETWIALGAYPWNRCPIVDHHTAPGQDETPTQGFFFGLDDHGRLGLYLSAGGTWQGITSRTQLPLRTWVHVGGVYDTRSGVALYINGEPAGSVKVDGQFEPAGTTPLLIGKNRYKANPTRQVHPGRYYPVGNYFDGVIDELKLFDRALTGQQITSSFAKHRPQDRAAKALPLRELPSGPPGPGPFGGYYTRLKYYEGWDALWRIGPKADVIVRFDEAPYKYVFWHGASYIPSWVTGNGIWYKNEFNETWAKGHLGAAEPMGDKQCRHSHVRIIENNDARVVAHWRYGLVDILYRFARVDGVTGWGDWSDEYHTIYPDGVGGRKITLHSSEPMKPHEWQESIIVLPPGKRPEDCLEDRAVTLVNMKGQTRSYSWSPAPPRAMNLPPRANIEVIDIKSKTRPFLIVSPNACLLRDGRPSKQPRFGAFGGGIKRELSKFPWWNHWPVAMIPSEGRYAAAADRASSSYITTGLEWEDHEVTPTSRTKIMLHGLSERQPGELVPLAKSWLQAPKLTEGQPRTRHGPSLS